MVKKTVLTTKKKPAATLKSPHQERVNQTMFTAIETLGKKLERVEDERDRLARRLAMIESAATVDEKTGKLYLPVATEHGQQPMLSQNSPKWMILSSVASSALALFALAIVLFRGPPPATLGLTHAQMAALDALTHPQFAEQSGRTWQESDNVDKAVTVAKNQWETQSVKRFVDIPEKDPVADVTHIEPAAGHAETVAPTQTASLTLTASPKSIEQTTPAYIYVPEPVVEKAPPPVIKETIEVAKTVAVPPAPVVETPVPAPKVAKAKPAPVAIKPAPAPVKKVAKKAKPAPKKEIVKATPKAKPAVITTIAAKKKPAKAEVTASRKILSSSYDVAPDKDLPEKLAALEKRAFDSVPEAQHDLATLYASGKLVAQDYKRAVYWFHKSSEGGIANADYNLGVMFQQGLGVKQDVEKSIGWYRRAAEMNHPEAMYNLGIAYIEGIGTNRNIGQGVAWFKRAANTGVAQAAFNLGVLYESSFVGAVDLAKATDWYQVAANDGHTDAMNAVDRIKAQLAQNEDQGLQLADLVEPASGMIGEGDASPIEETMDFRRNLVANIQEQLVKQGFLPRSALTGQIDPRTEDAIRAWQKQARLTIDGMPSEPLLQNMIK